MNKFTSQAMNQITFTTFLFACTMTAFSQAQSKPFVLDGSTTHMKGTIYFSYRGLGNDRIWDSTTIKNNHFQFRGDISEPAKALLTNQKLNRTSTVDRGVSNPLFLNPGMLRVHISNYNFRSLIMLGSKTNAEY